MSEQRNPYTGHVPRPVVRLTFCELDGTDHELTLLADTGSGYPVIVGREWFDRLVNHRRRVAPIHTNLGPLTEGWFHLYMPEFGLNQLVLAYRGPDIAESLAAENPDLHGLAGLPILRLGEYGGNATEFWFRYPTPTPHSP